MRLTECEQRLAYAAAGLAAVFSVVLWARELDRTAGVVITLIGLAMAGLLGLAARSRSRLLTGGAAFLLTFGPWAMFWVVGALFLLLALWIWFRAKPAADDNADPEAEPSPVSEREPRSQPTRNRRYTPPTSKR